MQRWHWFQQNSTGTKYLIMSYIKFVFLRQVCQQIWLPWPLISRQILLLLCNSAPVLVKLYSKHVLAYLHVPRFCLFVHLGGGGWGCSLFSIGAEVNNIGPLWTLVFASHHDLMCNNSLSLYKSIVSEYCKCGNFRGWVIFAFFFCYCLLRKNYPTRK